MKKILTIAVASLAIAAVADSYSPEIGVTTLSLSLKNNILPVRFTSLAGSGSVTADALVCTNNIPLSSYLLAYVGGGYSAWILTASGWSPVGISKIDGVNVTPGAENTELAVGSAIWLSFSAKPASAINVSVYGKVTSDTSVAITAGAKNLVCNPTTGSKVPTLGGDGFPAKKDKVVVITDTNSGEYVYTGTKWLHRDTSGKVTDSELPTIPAHGGFWYISNGGVSGTISW